VVDHRNAVLDVVPVASIGIRNTVAIAEPDHAAFAAAGAVVVLWVGNVRVGVGARLRAQLAAVLDVRPLLDAAQVH
jgi:hypothetical protein